MADETPQVEAPLFAPERSPVLARRIKDKSMWHVYYVAAEGVWKMCDCGVEKQINFEEWERP